MLGVVAGVGCFVVAAAAVAVAVAVAVVVVVVVVAAAAVVVVVVVVDNDIHVLNKCHFTMTVRVMSKQFELLWSL